MKQSVYHQQYRSERYRLAHPMLRGVGSLLNLSGRSVWCDVYMLGNLESDFQKDAIALKKDGLAVMSEFNISW